MPAVNLYKLWIDGKSLFAMACFKWGAFSTLLLRAKGTDEVIKSTSPGKCPFSWEEHFIESPIFLDVCKVVFIVSLRSLVARQLWVWGGLLWRQLFAVFCLAIQAFQISFKKTGIYYHSFITKVLGSPLLEGFIKKNGMLIERKCPSWMKRDLRTPVNWIGDT